MFHKSLHITSFIKVGLIRYTAEVYANFMAKYEYMFSSPYAVKRPTLHSFYHVSSRMKYMLEVPRRPTMQEIQTRRRSSFTETRLNKRLGASLPNFGFDGSISFQRNTLLTSIIAPEIGKIWWNV